MLPSPACPRREQINALGLHYHADRPEIYWLELGGWGEIQMPIGVGILSNLLLAAAPGEVLVYKLQSVLWSLFLLSPGLALLPIQLKGFLASKGGG